MERFVTVANGTRLCIDELGPADGPLLVQLEGHMAQYISTPQSYCEALAGHGFRVVRVDNRDVGGSQRFPGAEYTLDAMAEDVHGLVGLLGGPAVVCGRSMGGAIAQVLALRHPADVAGLGLFFTFAKHEPSSPPLPPAPAPFTGEEEFVAWEHKALPAIAGPDHPYPPGHIEWLARTMWARGVDWSGFERQRRAIGLQQPWAADLAEVGVPVSIVHGEQDGVVPVAAAHRLAWWLPRARCVLVPGLGHQQPPELDDVFVRATLHAAGEDCRN